MTPDLTPEELATAERALTDALTGKDAAAAKADKLAQLAPLGFDDARAEDAPDAIYHPVFGVIDHKALTLETIVQVAFNEGRIHGRNELRAVLIPHMKPE